MKKGFTLVELIAIIVVLGLISLIVVPVVNNTIKNTKQKSYDAQIAIIIEGANKWGVKNVEKLPVEDEVVYVKLNELISGGFIENVQNGKLKNPIDGTEMNGCVAIKYVAEYNQYTYEYSDECL